MKHSPSRPAPPPGRAVPRRALLQAVAAAVTGAALLRRARADTVPDLSLSDLRLITSEFAPYSTSENGQAKGVVIDRARQVLQQVGLSVPIEVYPWARAYETALRTPGALLFAVARTPEREDLFKWVGEAATFKVALFRSAQRPDVAPATLEEAGRYRIGALLKDVKGAYLTGKKIPHEVIADEELGIRMLIHGRLDLLPSDVRSMLYRLDQMGLPPTAVTEALPLPDISRPLYFAFNRETPDRIVETFRQALSTLPEPEQY